VLSAGSTVGPAEIGLLATVGAIGIQVQHPERLPLPMVPVSCLDLVHAPDDDDASSNHSPEGGWNRKDLLFISFIASTRSAMPRICD
jgi:hypothetical protein